jgi:hypothetical protein
MRRACAAALLILGCVASLMVTAPARASERDPLVVTDTTVRGGGKVTAYGWDCPSRANVQLHLDERLIEEVLADKKGRFAANLTIEAKTRSGKHRLRARCGKKVLSGRALYVVRSGISVYPRLVLPGARMTVVGEGCPQGSKANVRIDGTLVDTILVGSSGRFNSTLTVSAQAQRGHSLVVTAQCGNRFVGSTLARVMKPFPLYERDLVLISRTAVPAGQAVGLSFEDCPDLAPTALLDGKRMALTLDRTDRGDGFVARAVIPRKTVPGRYQLSAGCDVEAFGNTEIQVLDPASPEAVTSRNAFGVRTGSDLAIWAGALVGVALLVASIGINWRGRI